MRLEYQTLVKNYPDLLDRIDKLPNRLFSGKEHPSKGTRAVFLCFVMPAPPPPLETPSETQEQAWTTDGGDAKWYLFDLETQKIIEDPTQIVGFIRCTPETPRKHDVPEKTLSEIRANLEKHIKDTFLKQVQAPVGVKPKLRAWMELS
jgi:hypothetical protein